MRPFTKKNDWYRVSDDPYYNYQPPKSKLKFWDKVRYHYKGSNWDWCTWVVIDQKYHRCYQDYETKVNVKLKQWWYTDVWMWENNLKKIRIKHQWGNNSDF